MTSELVVMNTGAVALAADSVVTIGVERTYHSANKVFLLSRHVGVMVYGRAFFMGVPWDGPIKLFRRKLGNKPLPELDNYVADFVRFIDEAGEMQVALPLQFTREAFLDLVHGHFALLTWDIKNRLMQSESFSTRTWGNVGMQTIKQMHERYAKLPVASCFAGMSDPDGWAESIMADYGEAWKEAWREEVETISLLFSEEPMLSYARGIAKFALYKQVFSDFRLSGLVFVGYGSTEAFPSCVRIVTEGLVGPKLKWWKAETQKATPAEGSRVMAFAQADVVELFLSGIERDTRDSVLTALTGKLGSVLTALTGKFQGDLLQELTSRIANMAGEVIDSCGERHRSEVLSIIETLPRDELAAMAEFLINLTSLKRRVSGASNESVGGPVDVAVITKADGFVWLKRKNYFKQHLNPHYGAAYHRSMAGWQEGNGNGEGR